MDWIPGSEAGRVHSKSVVTLLDFCIVRKMESYIFFCQGLEIALLGYKTIFLLDPIIKLGIARNCRSLSSFSILATQFVIVVLLAKSKQLYFCENWISELILMTTKMILEKPNLFLPSVGNKTRCWPWKGCAFS